VQHPDHHEGHQPNDLKALSKGLEGMTSDLEEEIKRCPAGVAML